MISIGDLGIVRGVDVLSDHVTVTITPTYSGCPAMRVIEDDIRSMLAGMGIDSVTVNMVYSPAWTTDWIGIEAREKLRKFGIAPPTGDASVEEPTVSINNIIQCPHCKSYRTEQISSFGSTACKALYRCLECREPFDYFKAF